MRYFKSLLRQCFASPIFYAAALLFAALCMFSASAIVDGDRYQMFEILLDRSLYGRARTDIMGSSFMFINSFSSSEWFAVFIAVITALPALFLYSSGCENTRGFELIRGSYRSYSFGTVMFAYISGAAVVLLGTLIFGLVTYSLFPNFDSFDEEMLHSIYGGASERLGTLLKLVLNAAAAGGFYPILSVMIRSVISDYFLSLTIPMMINYASSKLDAVYYNWYSSDPKLNGNGLFGILRPLFPSNAPNAVTLIERGTNAPFFLFYVIAAAYMVGLCVVFLRLIKGGSRL